LKHNSFLAGNTFTIADVSLYCWLYPLFACVFDEAVRKANFSLVRWFKTTGSVDEVKKYFRGGFFAKEDWYGESKKKAEPKKKEEKPKAKKEEKKEEEAVDVMVKAKNPLDALPPTNFNFFDFKTLFVNAPKKSDALDFFWKNYDPAGFSLWYIKYIKYEGEGVKLFLTANLKDSFI